eukprot:CAMPEP_0176413482 /NCGR_PEP_ID=MMETSP0127-20121128/4725_1 /TAXON_ID=938130 /ORGANISM="Platyophrya macrostoma, Strain WH" /LENGTH=520 /DNA_ID=CAMNT_0017793271 /DNA_START=58 /DNA_END=1620 /DNA_ORIENTATION=+
MSEPLEPWIAATQTNLGAVITAPKLTDKLLRKPPFRFLHDIVTNFIKAASFPVGLYSDDMLDSSKCVEKEQKLAFLQSLVTVVQAATGKQTTAKPAKIIAGAEPEGTNDLLQLLATCAQLSPKDKEKAVKKALGQDSSASAPPQQQPPPAPAAAPQPTANTGAQPQQQPSDNKTAEEPPKRRSKQETPPPAAPGPATPVASDQAPAGSTSNSAGGSSVQQRLQARAAAAAAASGSTPTTATPTTAAQGDALQPSPLTPASANAQERPGTATARKAPPKVASNEVVENRAEPVQPVAGVIVEAKRGKSGDEDDTNNKEQDWMRLVDSEENAAGRAGGAGGNAEDAKGYLAQQALKAKKEQEEAAKKAAEARAASGETGGGGSEIVLNVQKRDKTGSAMGDGELSKLREQLQLLTKASNPLGKFLEAIHEDMDTMSRELDMWRTEARTQAAAAREAQRETEQGLHEVNVQLQALEDSISDQLTKTNILRAKILDNEKTIDTMVKMVVNPDSAKASSSASAKR